MVDKSFRNKTYLYTCFVDLRKAFDTVWCEALCHKLLRYGVCGKLVIRTHLAYIANVKNRVIRNNKVTVLSACAALTSFTTEK